MKKEINLSNNSVVHRGKIEMNFDVKKYDCNYVVQCYNLDCDECIFDYENKVEYKEVIKRVLE